MVAGSPRPAAVAAAVHTWARYSLVDFGPGVSIVEPTSASLAQHHVVVADLDAVLNLQCDLAATSAHAALPSAAGNSLSPDADGPDSDDHLHVLCHSVRRAAWLRLHSVAVVAGYVANAGLPLEGTQPNRQGRSPALPCTVRQPQGLGRYRKHIGNLDNGSTSCNGTDAP